MNYLENYSFLLSAYWQDRNMSKGWLLCWRTSIHITQQEHITNLAHCGAAQSLYAAGQKRPTYIY